MGNYRLLRTIGKGNFAKVKLARHILTGREVSGGDRGAEVGGQGSGAIKRRCDVRSRLVLAGPLISENCPTCSEFKGGFVLLFCLETLLCVALAFLELAL